MTRDPQTCYYCGHHSPRVEAGGIWHCPNLFCLGPGAFYSRTKAGYHGEDGVLTSENEARMIADCAVAINRCDDDALVKAMRRCLKKLIAQRAERG